MPAESPQPEYLTTREVARLLRVKERKVYDLAATGRIPCRRVTGKLLFPRSAVEAWLSGDESAAQPRTMSSLPANVVAGSHDPLLDWALRESNSGLAAYFDGSLDGLERIASGEAIVCGMHVFEPENENWNVAHVANALGGTPYVLIEWARRTQGLIMDPANATGIRAIEDLAGRRVSLRQPKAGARILFDHLLARAGLDLDAVDIAPDTARTEADAAASVASGNADATIGLEAMARQYRLAFVPLADERYDLLIERRAFFEPPLQALFAFCRSEAFAARAATLDGYDISGFGTVRWNG